MPHLLIIDDELSTSWALAEGLTDDGYTIDTFRSAEAAWDWLRRGHSDLVITDLRLPGMSGLELARKLRRGRAAQPVIVVTAYGSTEVEADLQRAGVAGCFPKPFAMDALRRAVRQALAERAARSTAQRKSANTSRREPRVRLRRAA